MDNELGARVHWSPESGLLTSFIYERKCLIDNLLSPSSVGSHPNVFNVMCTVVHDINKVQLFVTSILFCIASLCAFSFTQAQCLS